MDEYTRQIQSEYTRQIESERVHQADLVLYDFPEHSCAVRCVPIYFKANRPAQTATRPRLRRKNSAHEGIGCVAYVHVYPSIDVWKAVRPMAYYL